MCPGYIVGDDAEHPLKKAEVDLVSRDDTGQTRVALQELLVNSPVK